MDLQSFSIVDIKVAFKKVKCFGSIYGKKECNGT